MKICFWWIITLFVPARVVDAIDALDASGEIGRFNLRKIQIILMGIFSRFRGKKKDELALPPLGGGEGGIAPREPVTPATIERGSLKAQTDLLMAQVDSLRVQYEAINARLQNIERLVMEIRGFCR
jgi:hypothetical protein